MRSSTIRNPRRTSWQTAARATEGTIKAPNSSYFKRGGASSGGIAVLTPKGTSCPYRLETVPSGELALTKKVAASRHFLRQPPAIAFDRSILKSAEQKGASVVLVLDTETRTIYRASLALIWQKGFPVNRGFGEQQALPLYLWETGDSLQMALVEA